MCYERIVLTLERTGVKMAAHYALYNNTLLVFVMRLSLRLSSVVSLMLFQEILVMTTERSVVFD